jgi:hypothetical protein
LAQEKELRDRRERVRRAQEANKKAGGQGDAGGFFGGSAGAGGGGNFGAGPFSELFKVPNLKKYFLNKRIQELADDPEMLNALKNDPTLAKVNNHFYGSNTRFLLRFLVLIALFRSKILVEFIKMHKSASNLKKC